MNKQYLIYFCYNFYQTTNCPICLFKGKQPIFSLPESKLSFYHYHSDSLFEKDGYISYLITDSALCYGCVKSRSGDVHFLLGPYALNHCTHNNILSIMKEYGILDAQLDEITNYFNVIAWGFFPYFSKLLGMANFVLNRENINVEEYLNLINEAKYLINEEHFEAIYDTKENSSFHDTYDLEQLICHNVEKGNVKYFQQTLIRNADYQIGLLADNNLRQVKNIFIVSTTLATRAAIRGGLLMETAYQLSDQYIRAMEKLISIDAVSRLSGTMILDFTERVAASKIPNDISDQIYQCIQYIQLHTNCRITVQDVANAIGMSRCCISSKFKREMGFEIGQFIMRCKLEEAKSLLLHSQKSLAEISFYLCFSSQSYFHNVFKKQYGLTPKEYRFQAKKLAVK